MRYTIQHSIPGRLRVSLHGTIPERHAVALEELFLGVPCVTKCVAYPKAGSLAITYEAESAQAQAAARNEVLSRLGQLTYDQVETWEPTDSLMMAPKPRHLFTKLANMALLHYLRRAFLPQPVKMALRLRHALPFWKEAFASLRAGRLDVPVLDGAAIAMGFLQGDGTSAGSSMYLLNVGAALEHYTQRRSECSLARSLMDIPNKARKVEGFEEREVAIAELALGDVVVSRLGDSIPVDGEVVGGTAAVNQSSLTGEPLAVVRTVGDSVYAGTVVEDGEVRIRITGDPLQSKVRSIVHIVEQAEAMKSASQKRIESAADKLVPWNFLLAGIVALTTRNFTKTAAALMVDYSCALKLSGSIAVMAAQRESAKRGFVVKGSRFFDAMATADCIVFDKTGTLTAAEPGVCGVDAYNGHNEREVLRFAACLEEHFPHPVARAVVNKALELQLAHREEHAEVEYIVAHGIATTIHGRRAVIGSEHFVLEDEHVPLDALELERIHEKAGGASPLFLAVDGVLEGVIYIEDPLKPNVARVVAQLKEAGFKRVIMLTGDNERTAKLVAEKAGIEDFKADLLPEDKHALVHQLQEEGYKVAMVGDGVNDTPALSAAHVSIAMSGGSAVAREAADISLVSDSLEALVDLRHLSMVLNKRMSRGYRTAVAINSVLLALGISGTITPQTSSLLHNASTVALSAANARAFLPAGE
ncbi:MAG: heavy metal translocating P-type ATPase [Coriobacteriia bacterium]|nr:heavy metal translocating P-type ATPase [Coriobacteriia bacterium]